MAGEQLIEVRHRTRGYGKCRSCGAHITWFDTLAGKRMPFDGTPLPRKTRHDEQTHELIEAYSSDDVHWRTCPDAQQWRSRGKDRHAEETRGR